MKTLKTLSASAILLAILFALALPVRAEEVMIDFDKSETDKTPADFSTVLTGGGGSVSWVIQEDPTAPGGGKVLAQTSTDNTDYRFPICVYDKFMGKDVEVSVRF
ncbi:MAG: hypothetical protein L0Y56_15405, partial [Nitrospira sp.]|nr:hypothetical protein [Nitrospira sp.]